MRSFCGPSKAGRNRGGRRIKDIMPKEVKHKVAIVRGTALRSSSKPTCLVAANTTACD
jgi:hypothetical protein